VAYYDYALDGAGTITSRTITGSAVANSTTTYAHNDGNRITSSTPGGVTTSDAGQQLGRRGTTSGSHALGAIGTGRSGGRATSRPDRNVHFRFAGGYQDETTSKLVHFGQRLYDPTQGRWTQPDPLDQSGDLRQGNVYAYAAGDPVNLTDPLGTQVGNTLELGQALSDAQSRAPYHLIRSYCVGATFAGRAQAVRITYIVRTTGRYVVTRTPLGALASAAVCGYVGVSDLVGG